MSEHELNMISQLREKIEGLEFELKDLKDQMAKKLTYIDDLHAEISHLKKKLPPDQGAKKGPDGVLKLREVKSDD